MCVSLTLWSVLPFLSSIIHVSVLGFAKRLGAHKNVGYKDLIHNVCNTQTQISLNTAKNGYFLYNRRSIVICGSGSTVVLYQTFSSSIPTMGDEITPGFIVQNVDLKYPRLRF